MNSLLVALFALIASTFQTRVALQAAYPPLVLRLVSLNILNCSVGMRATVETVQKSR
jgi:hypothetical protein